MVKKILYLFYFYFFECTFSEQTEQNIPFCVKTDFINNNDKSVGYILIFHNLKKTLLYKQNTILHTGTFLQGIHKSDAV